MREAGAVESSPYREKGSSVLKKVVKDQLEAVTKTALETIRTETRNAERQRANVDVILRAVMAEAVKLPLNDAYRYAEFIRGCIEPMRAEVSLVKPLADEPDFWSRRFDALLERFRVGLSPIPLSLARDMALVADRYHGLSGAIDDDRWAGDQGYHFTVSSSFGSKARVLTQTVWCMRPGKCLELGTAYGMSGMFIVETQKRLGLAPHLVTVEGASRQHGIAAETLTSRYGTAVTCHLGMTTDVLPRVLAGDRSVNFVFHDAGHDYESYVNDFAAILPSLAPGAVLMMDDIRWEDSRFSDTDAARTYEGWRAVVSNPRVRTAIEVNGEFGVLLIA